MGPGRSGECEGVGLWGQVSGDVGPGGQVSLGVWGHRS